MSGIAPIALLDEIAAHFDPTRRAALFDALTRLGGQAFLTGADPVAFAASREALLPAQLLAELLERSPLRL